jgi:hypothetical protein
VEDGFQHCLLRFTVMVLAVGAFRASTGAADWTDTSGHRVLFVNVAAGVNLEVLDSGGNGPPLLLLAGLNNTAHVFDLVAHQFTSKYHVFGDHSERIRRFNPPANGLRFVDARARYYSGR